LSIGEWVARRALRRPTATALIDADTGQVTSYAELDDGVRATAAALHELGVRRGDRIALIMENSPEFVHVLFGAANLGAVVVPVNFRLAAPEIAYLLTDSGAMTLAVSDRFASLASAALAACSGRHGVRQVITETVDGGLAGLPTATVGSLIAGTVERRGPDPVIGGDDVSVIMYTSGTTGSPKGAMLTHANMQWNAINMLTVGDGMSGSTVTIAVAPMFHIGALGLSVLPVLYAGGTVVMVRAFDPSRTLELIEKHSVTSQFMVPAMWSLLSQVPDFDSHDVSSVRWALCGGAPCPLPVIEFYQQRGWRFLEGFGMTETSPSVLLLDEEFVVSHAGSVGRPFMHVDVRIVDLEDHDVAVGEVGELVLRGPNVFAGYWGRPVETAEVMRGGWFHSGDLGRFDTDGFVTLVDRKKDMIISGGENVYPIEVEQVLFRHPLINDVAVIGVPDPKWGETVLAVVVPAASSGLDCDVVIAHARERIAHFKCPRRVEFVDELPRNATGKILKRTLRERYTGVGDAVHR
jgi:fatty-acyl-CoA synthase